MTCDSAIRSLMSNRLEFGVKADKFEAALDELAEILGFAGQRPDRQQGAGPDNLWQVREQDYVLWECKNEVKLDRELIHKDETGQMNNACGWFDEHYKGATASRIMIIPAQKCAPGAHFTHDVRIMRPKELQKFKGAPQLATTSSAKRAVSPEVEAVSTGAVEPRTDELAFANLTWCSLSAARPGYCICASLDRLSSEPPPAVHARCGIGGSCLGAGDKVEVSLPTAFRGRDGVP